MYANTEKSLLTRLQQFPTLCERLASLLDIVENAGGDHTKADAAEQAMRDEVRKLGHTALQSWATQAVAPASWSAERQLRFSVPKLSPINSPTFAPTCTPKSKDRDLGIQQHE
jgi:hypothetical protein